MDFIDSKTIYFIYVLTSIISSVVLGSLWKENHHRFPQIALWFFNTVLQASGFLLMILRDVIPDFFSMVVANGFIISGIILLTVGLEQFIGRKPVLWPRGLLLATFIAIHAYFTFTVPNLAIRNINASAALVILATRTSWVLLFQENRKMRELTRATAFAMLAHVLASLYHIYINLTVTTGKDLFNQGIQNPILILSYMLIYLCLIFTLVLIVTKRTNEELEQSENKFSTAFKTAPYALSITSLIDGKLLAFNEAFVSLTEYSCSELTGKTTMELNLWASKTERTDLLVDIQNGIKIKNKEMQFRTKNGRLISCLFSTEYISLNEGACLLSSITDISERIAMETEIRQNKAFLSGIIEHSGNLICVKDRDGKYKLVNKKWEQVTELGRDEALGKTDLELFPGFVGETFHANDQIALLADGDTEHEEILETPSGTRYFLSIKFPLQDEKGIVSGTCAMISDITERKQAEFQIQHLANHDYLTDLPTMRLAWECLAVAVQNAQTNNKPGALLYLDLDGFKKVNDTIGHNGGDFVLQEISRRLETCRKQKDTVARVGGDEFLFIMAEAGTPKDAILLAEMILGKINEPISIEETTFHVSTSIGIVFFPDQENDHNNLVKKADLAMYESKKKGKNRWTIAD